MTCAEFSWDVMVERIERKTDILFCSVEDQIHANYFMVNAKKFPNIYNYYNEVIDKLLIANENIAPIYFEFVAKKQEKGYYNVVIIYEEIAV